MTHCGCFRANALNAASVYVAISRARTSAAVYTDSRSSLTEALGFRDGVQVGAIDGTMKKNRSLAKDNALAFNDLNILIP